jgi:hypothetical protein
MLSEEHHLPHSIPGLQSDWSQVTVSLSYLLPGLTSKDGVLLMACSQQTERSFSSQLVMRQVATS